MSITLNELAELPLAAAIDQIRRLQRKTLRQAAQELSISVSDYMELIDKEAEAFIPELGEFDVLVHCHRCEKDFFRRPILNVAFPSYVCHDCLTKESKCQSEEEWGPRTSYFSGSLAARKYLRELGRLYFEQDNAYTAYPILVVLQEEKEIGEDGQTEWVNQQSFLTMEAYKQHLRENKHNYGEVRPFIQHQFRSTEMEKLIEALSKI